ncbi:MAG: type II toxin-antitoxin system RelB/DinJ family antitoxin [Ruminococcaceae bacterium]|jgi:addiction module RelB/DinJ family antitoxin|nr:type II toxin-antitoxin system RelB/DinJ family antitoxin [Oscillospiraceae bacterium]
MSKVSTNISLDEDLKKEAQALFAEFGLDLTTAITIFLKQSVREGRIPFAIRKVREHEKYGYTTHQPAESSHLMEVWDEVARRMG